MCQEHKDDNRIWQFCLPIGIALGTGFGALFGNVGVGMSFGIALGTIFSLLIYYRMRSKYQQ